MVLFLVKERQASLERQIQEMNEYKQKIETQNITIETLESEKKILMNDVGNLSAICTKLVNGNIRFSILWISFILNNYLDKRFRIRNVRSGSVGYGENDEAKFRRI